jgi:hypothetical protein
MQQRAGNRLILRRNFTDLVTVLSVRVREKSKRVKLLGATPFSVYEEFYRSLTFCLDSNPQ